jgi:hypothetical protein
MRGGSKYLATNVKPGDVAVKHGPGGLCASIKLWVRLA